MMNALMSTAVVPSPGTARASMGMMAPPVTALFADSGAATPSGMPVPNLLGSLAFVFSVL